MAGLVSSVQDVFDDFKQRAEQIQGFRQRVEEVGTLPPMPEVATRILRLRDDPNADALHLAKLIELDPGLAAQVVRYASSALYGYRGKIDSIHDAIARVLGYDKVLDLALGLALGKSLTHSHSGPLGIQEFWRHAIYSAVLMQFLAIRLTAQERPVAGLLYLSGLLHNIGYLVLGHCFKTEFTLLNDAIEKHPSVPITAVENKLLEVNHYEIGSWLLRSWSMPTEILTAVYCHHNPEYRGDHSVYANLCYVADCLLSRHGIGDVGDGELPAETLHHLGLSEESVEAALEQLMQSSDDFDALVSGAVQAA